MLDDFLQNKINHLSHLKSADCIFGSNVYSIQRPTNALCSKSKMNVTLLELNKPCLAGIQWSLIHVAQNIVCLSFFVLHDWLKTSALTLSSLGVYITTATWCYPMPFIQWEHSFQMKVALPLAKRFTPASDHFVNKLPFVWFKIHVQFISS